ncbi:hypothetical protein [Streptomyces sp. 142MFCol3.1]|uniref:hypothetical protein n=1 Tax=Streptomyces sp. 142MFCol3.1 TaxID=1172179 RepID=UPI00041393FD|nr:hypothetical protein [Streptomyces sp. 142MFCol3.1]
MSEIFVGLGNVDAPSGVLVLGMAGWIDQWRELGQPLSERARTAAASGGGHLREWLCEAVAVPAAGDRPLTVRASTSPSPFEKQPAIATLEFGLGPPWPESAGRPVPVRLGDLPVDRCRMVVGDATALDAWTGMDDEPADRLADVFYRGLYADGAHAQFGGEQIARYGTDGPRGWLDLPVAEAAARAAELTAWRDRLHGKGLMVLVDKHTDNYRFRRAGWHHPLRAGAIEVGGCHLLGIEWDQGTIR